MNLRKFIREELNFIMESKIKFDNIENHKNIEWVPLDFVYKFRNKNIKDEGELIDGSLTDLNGLWNDIKKNGLKNPLVLIIGVEDDTIKLGIGNHRIEVFKRNNITSVPVVVKLTKNGTDDINGTHHYDGSKIIKLNNVKSAWKNNPNDTHSASSLIKKIT